MKKNNHWWRMSDAVSDEGALATKICEAMSETDRFRKSQLRAAYRLRWAYERDRLLAKYGVSQALACGPSGLVRDHFTWLDGEASVPSPNIVKAHTDTIVAWLFGEAPNISVRADGASFEDQYSIEEYELAVDSLFNPPHVQETLMEVARDATLSGVGYAMPTYDNGVLGIKRLLPWQVYLNPLDARAKNPKSVHVVEFRTRSGIKAWLGAWEGVKRKKSKLEAIDRMTSMSRLPGNDATHSWSLYDHELTSDTAYQEADQLMVVHSWHAASRPGADDGRYVVTVRGATCSTPTVMLDQMFASTTLPVCWLLVDPSEEGIQGTGFGHLMISYQETIDRLYFRVQRSLDRYGNIKFLVPKGPNARAHKEALAHEGISYIEFEGNIPGGKPIIFDPQVVRPEDMQRISQLLGESSSIYGINAMMSRGASQLGANASGQALQEEFYRSLDRFSPLVQRYHGFRLRLAYELLLLVDDVVKWDKGFRASYLMLGRSETRTWADLSSFRDRANVRLENRGTAATRRGGRTARIQEWAAQGLIAADVAKEELLSNPDARHASRLALAPIRMVEWQLRKVIENTDLDRAQPNRDTDLDLAIRRATAMISLAYVEGASDDTIERLRAYKLAAEELLRQMQMAAQPPPAAVPGGAMNSFS